MSLGERKKIILKAVVDGYIGSAEPVGSKSLTAQLGLRLSPATIRNEMSELESMGYLEQPHKSAGRVPSNLGYRMYVDELMNNHTLSAREMQAINNSLQVKARQLDKLIEEAGRLISGLTNYAAYATVSHKSGPRLKRIDIIPVDRDTFVLVLLFSTNILKNIIGKKFAQITDSKLYLVAALLNAKLVNCTSNELIHVSAEDVAQAAGVAESFVQWILDYIRDVMEELEESMVYVGGVEHMLEQPEFSNVMKAHKVLEFLSDRVSVAQLPSPDEDGPIKILIGPENVGNELHESSVVAASYEIGEGMKGIIGVVGPTRMDYSTVAAKLRYFTNRLNKLINLELAEGDLLNNEQNK